MRVNIYAEEMTDRIQIISKEIEGQTFTGLRFYLALPASFVPNPLPPDSGDNLRPATVDDTVQATHFQAPFIHRPGDDDSAAVTFWGKKSLRGVLLHALAELESYESARATIDRKHQTEVKNAIEIATNENGDVLWTEPYYLKRIHGAGETFVKDRTHYYVVKSSLTKGKHGGALVEHVLRATGEPIAR